jgi:hypothetical protein
MLRLAIATLAISFASTAYAQECKSLQRCSYQHQWCMRDCYIATDNIPDYPSKARGFANCSNNCARVYDACYAYQVKSCR